MLGAVLGGISGYYGGVVDTLIPRVIEFLLSIPTIPLWMALSAAVPVSWPEFGHLHPFAPREQAEGYRLLCDQLERWLCEITGFSAISFQPNAGAQGEYTGLLSKAMTAPDGKIRIPLNEEASKGTGQIEEFLMQYNGEGIQHIALICDDLFACWDRLKARGVPFMTPPPDTYYEMLDERLPGHGEPVGELKSRGILLDGSTEEGDPRLLLQIFSETLIGPVFFEFIQRKKDEGFGEGNFKALFESIERDQIRRGVDVAG